MKASSTDDDAIRELRSLVSDLRVRDAEVAHAAWSACHVLGVRSGADGDWDSRVRADLEWLRETSRRYRAGELTLEQVELALFRRKEALSSRPSTELLLRIAECLDPRVAPTVLPALKHLLAVLVAVLVRGTSPVLVPGTSPGTSLRDLGNCLICLMSLDS